MTLTLAIPSHNDTAPLCRLLAGVRPLDCVAHVVVVDDGSDTAIAAGGLARASGLDPDRITLLRNDTARGPGAARNRALEHVTTEYMLFLDADDQVTPDLPHLMRDLSGQSFDFCLFQHHDTRAEQDFAWGQMPWDQAHWRAAGVDLGALNAVAPAAAADLCQTANYPWNKICRTAFLRDHGIGCSGILVHEDVELHWRSFLNARTILASDRVCVIHGVAADGRRLTNRAGPERLDVFDPLDRIAREIAGRGDTLFTLPFYRFALGLCLWIRGNLRPEFHARLAGRVRTFADTHIPPDLLAALHRDDPGRMQRIAAMIAPEQSPFSPAAP